MPTQSIWREVCFRSQSRISDESGMRHPVNANDMSIQEEHPTSHPRNTIEMSVGTTRSREEGNHLEVMPISAPQDSNSKTTHELI